MELQYLVLTTQKQKYDTKELFNTIQDHIEILYKCTQLELKHDS